MSNLDRIGNKISVPVKADSSGYLGRECPEKTCLGYFKIKPGTGLSGKNLPCFCPYCGHKAGHDHFWTREQLKYAESFAINKVTGALLQDLKSMEFDHRASGAFGIGISLKVSGEPHPIRHYREKSLETEVVCEHCTLGYAIYGVFGHCPDCGTHNSLQILNKNLEIAEKEISLAATIEGDLAGHLIGDALKNAVAAFDGFGREACRVSANKATEPGRVESLSFQNLVGAQGRVLNLFGFDFAAKLTSDEWSLTCRCFQKRHLLAHKMGVIDQAYVKSAVDPRAIVGRKVRVEVAEVKELVRVLRTLGGTITDAIG